MQNEFEKYICKITPTSPRDQWVKMAERNKLVQSIDGSKGLNMIITILLDTINALMIISLKYHVGVGQDLSYE